MTLDERIAFLEGRVQEHGQMLNGVREAIVSLEARMDRRFEAIDRRFEAIDRRFDAIDRRFAAIDERFVAIDQRFVAIDQRFVGIDHRFLGIDQRLDQLDQRMARQFMWLVGLQVTTLVAVTAAVLAR